MIRLAVVSGKGGTGKTVISASLALLLPGKKILVDADVDASNLPLLLSPKKIWEKPFFGMEKAHIDPDRCLQCGACRNSCRSGAVRLDENRYRVENFRCEGCAACTLVCPAEAITMVRHRSGVVTCGLTGAGPLVYAHLFPGEGNSGLLVHELKKIASQRVDGFDLMLVDGPPGTGCPLISTVSGTDLLVVVTEPSVSGDHDFQRVIRVANRFRPRIRVVINRADLNPDRVVSIEQFCREQNIPVIGRIPFDESVIRWVRGGEPAPLTSGPASEAIHTIASNIAQELGTP
ncbi:MinD superfamily P-loop ATPase [Methanolinea mesophila]|uniref:ATP-binding protein n=1 Tax=Methanolinea mesophila TaxID=547055 RepID=UPI001AE8E651|nr:ATP-binding protein [Methanolinea mesophila]MBP1928487.1 MinD superfamily P-loop ATPase [Methanolinea mesophila]